MKRALIFQTTLATLGLLLAACASAPATVEASAPSIDAPVVSTDEKQRKVEGLERKLEIAGARLALAQLESEAFDQEQEVRVRHAEAEVAMAEARLERFREADVPNRLASEQLDLRSAKDRAQEAADELAQIEIMYKDQDLDDLTAEFVVARGRRSAERAAARIEIMEGKLRAIEERELPAEDEGFKLALDKATAAMAKVATDGEIGRRGKLIAIRQVESEIANLDGELVAARKESDS